MFYSAKFGGNATGGIDGCQNNAPPTHPHRCITGTASTHRVNYLVDCSMKQLLIPTLSIQLVNNHNNIHCKLPQCY